MKLLTMIFTMITITVVLAGCQNTASGFTNDVSKNTASIRKAINEN